VGTVTSAGSETLSLQATVDPGIGGSTLVNTASVSAVDQADGDPSNNADSVRVEPQAAELAVDKTVDNAAPAEGNMVTFTVSVTNNGPSGATGVQVTDVLPGGVSYDSSSPIGVYDNVTGLWEVGAIIAGATETLTITVNVDPGTAGFAIVNTASLTASDQADPDPANNSDSASLQVQSTGVGQVQITNAAATDQRPTWSPDGTQLAFDRNISGSVDIWRITALGGNPPSQITTRAVSDLHPDWSSDGTQIVFAAPSSAGGQPDLWLVPPTGGSPTLLAEDANGNDRFPSWSPDGTQVAFNKDSGSGHDIFVIPATGGTPVQITTDSGNDVHPTWSPDGTMLAFLSNRGNGDNNIWVIPAAGGTATQITFNTANDGAPDWSPDGTQIAFQSNRSGNNDIWLIPAGGGTAVQVTTALGVDAQPDWSPAGNQIAFARDGNIWVHTFSDPGDPAVTMTVDHATPREGNVVTYEATLANRGPGFVTGIQVVDVLPAGVSYRSAQPTQGTYEPQSGTWKVGSLASSATASLTIRAMVNFGTSGTTIQNVAQVIALHQEDLNLANNVASATIQIVQSVGMGRSMTAFVPSVHALETARPNPFRENTAIQFDIPHAEKAHLAIFDVTGRRVKTLVREEVAPGRYAPIWDGRDHSGRAVAPGVYFVRLESGSFTATQRVIRLR
jgi:uncharacterized repeat protein (TIGR01451 family)